MSPKRAASRPPELAGFEFINLLGSGGFADVFLYRQHMPKREVAVKVLLTDKLDGEEAASFEAEANLMAQLSSHPAIVTIYQAGVSADGRPYLVMENCPRPNLQVRHRKEPLSVAESLRIGIQIAGAVETAHRAGILHRDIKPANILVTAYNLPVLTDFGIAGTGEGEAVGMSIPWSPPESFAEQPKSSRQSDVYALGATLYTLLAGHSPFEVPGERNTSALLMDRIESTPVPPLRRGDVPPSLESLIAKAMAKKPSHRFATALEFAHALQRIQAELAMSTTPVDVLDDSAPDEVEEDGDDGRTRVRSVVSIDPRGPGKPSPGATPFSVPASPATSDASSQTRPTSTWGRTSGQPEADDATVMRPAGPASAAQADRTPFHTPVAPEPQVGETVMRPRPVEAETAPEPQPRSKKGLWIGVATVAILGAGVGIAMSLGGGGGQATNDAPATTAAAPITNAVDTRSASVPTGLQGVLDGAVATFSWDDAALEPGDVYQWRFVGDAGGFTSVTDATVSIDVPAGQAPCISVRTRLTNGRISETAEACAS